MNSINWIRVLDIAYNPNHKECYICNKKLRKISRVVVLCLQGIDDNIFICKKCDKPELKYLSDHELGNCPYKLTDIITLDTNTNTS
jgi:uncharacterized protein with PIN domain